MYKAVIFDLDGTILNTLDDLYYSTNYALESFNLPMRTYEEIRCFVGNGVRVLIEKAVGLSNQDKVDDVITSFKEHYKKHSMDHIHEYNGITNLLNNLKKDNILLAVVTNKFNLAAQEIVNKFFPNIFDVVLGEDPKLNRKPHPDMCNYVLKKLAINSNDALYVGDSEVDIITAKNANLKCITCTWGFRNKEELITSGAINLIDTPDELKQYLKK